MIYEWPDTDGVSKVEATDSGRLLAVPDGVTATQLTGSDVLSTGWAGLARPRISLTPNPRPHS